MHTCTLNSHMLIEFTQYFFFRKQTVKVTDEQESLPLSDESDSDAELDNMYSNSDSDEEQNENEDKENLQCFRWQELSYESKQEDGIISHIIIPTIHSRIKQQIKSCYY